MVPDFGGLIWMIIALIEGVLFTGFIILFVTWIMPPIARRMIRAKWSRGSIAFIQHAGRVRLCITKTELPEGVIENEYGWFMKSTVPYGSQDQTPEKRGPGRPPKNPEQKEAEPTLENVEKTLEVALRVPILEGLGKQVLFGSTDTSLLSNLEAIGALSPHKIKTKNKDGEDGVFSHAILNTLKAIIPATFGRTNLDALATLNYLRGLKVRGGEAMKIIIIAICVIGVIATVGLVFYFLTQGGT